MSTSAGSSGTSIPNPPIIALLSDFGLNDPYVASMKGVILSICRRAVLIDITHAVAKFNAQQGAYLLAATVSYFPPGTIHVCVVDPEVGTERKALLIKTRRSYLVGPDNGVLIPAADKEGLERVIEIRNRKYVLGRISSTFHGRDIFASVAGHLAEGVSAAEFGPEIEEYVRQKPSKPLVSRDRAVGQIIHIDGFGNIVTNISPDELNELKIRAGSMISVGIGLVTKRMKFCSTYNEVDVGEHLALVGSTGFLEVSVNRGNASSIHNAQEGSQVTVSSN
ncbi:MAG: SAM-dependent chlorinase/fluorinase [Promethearchaeati archaeon SRVP18_Atabeyarchaeia-1]